MSLYNFEYDKANEFNYTKICGVDEAGRGPLAGPVFAAAVILPLDFEIDGINDSKKLTEKKRQYLYDEIIKNAIAYDIEYGDNFLIDRINILNATLETMKKAVENLSLKPDIVYIDGNRIPNLNVKTEYLIKGDSISANIAAASILAKVSRDNYMYKMAELYPNYGFEKHKGYPTSLHYEKLREYGPCDIHRLSFLKKMH